MSLYRYFLLSAVSIFLIACTTEAPVDIEKAYWKTTVHLEELQVVRDASWHSEIPSDAYGIETYSKQRASIKVGCAMSSEGICLVPIKVPIYSDWSEYSVNRWNSVPGLVMSGVDFSPAFANAAGISSSHPPNISDRRVGERIVQYFFTIDSVDYEVDEKVWSYAEYRTSFVSIVQGKKIIAISVE